MYNTSVYSLVNGGITHKNSKYQKGDITGTQHDIMPPLTSIWYAVLYTNICCFISNFRSVFNFGYVSSPKFLLQQKVFLISEACISKIWNFRSFWTFLRCPFASYVLEMHRPIESQTAPLANSHCWYGIANGREWIINVKKIQFKTVSNADMAYITQLKQQKSKRFYYFGSTLP